MAARSGSSLIDASPGRSPVKPDHPSGRPAAARQDTETLPALLHGVAKAWREELDRRLRPLGLTRVQWQALLMISRASGGLTQRELAEKLEIGAPATVALVDRMERDGLVERAQVPDDRRANIVRATATSKRLFTRIEDTAVALRSEILSGMSAEELRTLHRLLSKARQRIEVIRA
jgi:MarR family transcriptional regulator for hemolysin